MVGADGLHLPPIVLLLLAHQYFKFVTCLQAQVWNAAWSVEIIIDHVVDFLLVAAKRQRRFWV